MPRYIAFLRAINVGGHTVTMEKLRALFEKLGFSNVETFIASGNVIFESPAKEAPALEKKIERHLEKFLGFEVKTFLRTDAELAALAAYEPFTSVLRKSAGALNVAFLSEPLSAENRKILGSLKTAIDDFHTNGREVYWLCKKKQSESTFSNALFERKLKVSATFRGINTVQRLAAKHAPPPGRS